MLLIDGDADKGEVGERRRRPAAAPAQPVDETGDIATSAGGVTSSSAMPARSRIEAK